MYHMRVRFLQIALVCLVVASAAKADNARCYDVGSLKGWYAVVAMYGSNVGIGLGRRYFDGSGRMTGTFVDNVPTPGSATGARNIIRGTQTGTYTVNCDGTGVITRMVKASNGVTLRQTDDFIITGALMEHNELIATALEDAQRTPSAIIPGGIFLFRSYTRLPEPPGH